MKSKVYISFWISLYFLDDIDNSNFLRKLQKLNKISRLVWRLQNKPLGIISFEMLWISTNFKVSQLWWDKKVHIWEYLNKFFKVLLFDCFWIKPPKRFSFFCCVSFHSNIHPRHQVGIEHNKQNIFFLIYRFSIVCISFHSNVHPRFQHTQVIFDQIDTLFL